MSTEYKTMAPVQFSALFGGRLAKQGIREHVSEDNSDPRRRCLTDGLNFLRIWEDKNGHVASLTRYGWSFPERILYAISTGFDVRIFSEHQPEYWGFNSKEEMRAAGAGF